jgi:hypothetical protein
VLRCPFDERVILGLVCAYANGIVAVENLGIHVIGLGLGFVLVSSLFRPSL